MVLSELDSAPSWEQVIAAEPTLGGVVSDERFDDALEAIGEFADLKSPWTIGHSRGSRILPRRRRAAPGFRAGDVVAIRRAACCARPRSAGRLEHGVGQAGSADAVRA